MEGRPIKVYDEPDISRPSPDIMKKQRQRRLPGRDISISSSEEELSSEDDEVISAIAANIVVVEDPVQKLPPPPRKSSLSHHANKQHASWDSQRSFDSSTASASSAMNNHQQQKNPTHKLSLEVPCAAPDLVNGGSLGDDVTEDGNGRNRKRSVSFHSLVIAEETAPVYEEQAATLKGASSAECQQGSGDSSKNTLKVQESERSRNRRKSIETLVRPPTPPKHFS